jgi:hypothetical protein
MTETADCTATVGIGQGMFDGAVTADVVGAVEGAETALDDDGRCWFCRAGEAPGVVVDVEWDTLGSGEDIGTFPAEVVPVVRVVAEDDVEGWKEGVTDTPVTSV